MPKFTNTFIGGLDRDTVPTNYDNKKYYNAKNFSIMVAEDLSSATLTNTKGVTLKMIATSSSGNRKIVGISEIADNLIIFIKTSTTLGKIYKIPFANITGSIINLESETYLKVRLAFDFGDRIEVVAREETTTIHKIYWVDGKNPLRYCDINLTLSSYTLDMFEVYQNITLTSPTYAKTIGGALTSGVYQYSYCLYNQNGGQTIYSPFSQFIQISDTGLTTTSSIFRGSNLGVASSSGVEINIQDNNTNYSFIRVVSIFYTAPNSVPEITIIYEGGLTNNLTIQHTGFELLGTITADEVVAIPNILIPSTITSKYNYLFIGNIQEESFDVEFDARAYRYFVGETYFTLYNDSTTYGDWAHLRNYTYPNFPTIDDYSYNLSPKNVLAWDTQNVNANRQSDGVTIGGEGPNIKYRFITHELPYTDRAKSLFFETDSTHTNGLGGYANPYENKFVGYQRDEIYRFGIIFFNAKGQSSFVKWIGDIRFPKYSDLYHDSTYFEILSYTDDEAVTALGIEFTLTGILPVGAVSYQIVRLERTYSNATVTDCGYIGHLKLEDPGKLYFGATRWDPTYIDTDKPGLIKSTAGIDAVKDVVEYICAETNYNKNNYSPADRLDIYYGAKSSSVKDERSIDAYTYNNAVVTEVYPLHNYNTSTTIEDSYLFTGKRDIDIDTGFYTLPTSFGSYSVYTRSEKAPNNTGYKGTTLLLKLEDDIIPAEAFNYRPGYAVRRNLTYPYGGFSESVLNSGIYYSCSEITSINTTTLDVYGGDTYISVFEYMRVLWAEEAGDNNRYVQIIQALVESKLNLNYTLNKRWTTYDSGEPASDIIALDLSYNAIWEKAGTWLFYKTTPYTYFIQSEDLYTYNPVYSLNTSTKSFVPKPINFIDNVSFPTRIYVSEKKINGEIQDSWLSFLVNNSLDLDNQFGDLTKLYNHNNRLFYFQKTGFGILPIEDREVITTSTSTSVSIGTGGVLQRYDYVSTNAGTSLPRSIVGTDNSLYFVDDNLRKICKLSGDDGFEYISDTQGLYSYMFNSILTEVNTLYNPKTKEIHFSFNNQTVPESLTYNEYTKTFVSFSDTLFKYGLFNNGYIYAIGEHFTHGLYRTYGITLGTGSYGSYLLEGNSNNDGVSTLELLINPSRQIVGRFDSMELSTEDYITTTNQPTTTFSTITAKNSYQDTGTIILVPTTNIIRRFRTWRFNTLRNSTDEGRLIDNFARLILTFNNTGVDKLMVSDISTTFSPLNIK